MPGSLDANLRSSFLNEELAILILRHFGAVAEIMRAEDSGIDCILTLLQRVSRRRYEPTDTAYIQIKSASVRGLSDKQVGGRKWLNGLSMPLFYARVARLKQTQLLEIYTSHLLFDELYLGPDAPLGISFEQAEASGRTVRLEVGDDSGSTERSPHLNLGAKTVWLGPPIIKMKLSEVIDEEGLTLAKQILAFHCATESRNRISGPFGFIERLKWDTNGPNGERDIFVKVPASKSYEARYLAAIERPANALIIDKLNRGNDSDKEFAKHLHAFLKRSNVKTLPDEALY